MTTDILNRVYYNNTVGDYLYACAVLLAGILLLRILHIIFNRLFIWEEKQLKNRGKPKDQNTNRYKSWSGMHLARISGLRIHTRKRLLKQVIFPLVFMAFFAFALFSLEFPPSDLILVKKIFYAILFVIALRAAVNGIEISFLRFSRKESHMEQTKSLKPLVSIVKLIIWILGLIFLMGNLGFDVTTAIAGLGISGIAIAIAAQGILGDLFGYFVILFDKPFTIGDLITVNDTYGWVEKIGIKTTHLRTLQGELVIISNTILSSANLHNYNQMQHRRVSLKVGVTYSTSQEHVEEIPSIIQHIIDTTEILEGVICDRSHFLGFGDSSLDFEAVYFVPVNDYRLFMDVQQDVNTRVYKTFNELGIEFAFPTQTIHYQRAETLPEMSQ